MRTASHTSDVIRPWPLVAVAAWAVPGLGHVVIGHARRGVVVGVTLLTLFVGGMLIGGIDVVDRKRDTLWFAGQVLIGPVAFAADYAHQKLDERRDQQAGQHDLTEMIARREPVAYRTSVNRVNEYGTLYCTLAGVMNLLVILDAVGRAAAAKAAFSRPSAVSSGSNDDPKGSATP